MHREAAKAGINISLAVQISAERNWQAFNAEYNWGGINPSAPSAKTLNEWETPTRAQILAKGPRSDGKVPHDKWDSGVHQFVFPLSDDIDPRMVDRQ